MKATPAIGKNLTVKEQYNILSQIAKANFDYILKNGCMEFTYNGAVPKDVVKFDVTLVPIENVELLYT